MSIYLSFLTSWIIHSFTRNLIRFDWGGKRKEGDAGNFTTDRISAASIQCCMKLGFPPSAWTKYFITCYHLFQYVNKIVIFLDKVPAFLVGSKKKQHLLVQKRRQNSCHFKFKANFTFYRSWMWKLIYRRSCSTKKKMFQADYYTLFRRFLPRLLYCCVRRE